MEQEQKKVVITEKRKEMLAQMPIVETKISTSKNGEFVIHRTIITDIKPKLYYDKVFAPKEERVEDL